MNAYAIKVLEDEIKRLQKEVNEMERDWVDPNTPEMKAIMKKINDLDRAVAILGTEWLKE